MKALTMSKFTEIWLPSFALILFFTVFIVMLIFIFRKTSGGIYEQVEKLPLDEGVSSDR